MYSNQWNNSNRREKEALIRDLKQKEKCSNKQEDEVEFYIAWKGGKETQTETSEEMLRNNLFFKDFIIIDTRCWAWKLLEDSRTTL